MSARKPRRGLARGLDSLIGDLANETPVPHEGEIEVKLIEANPFQPRRSFPEKSLADLADSIRSKGLLQPLLVRPKPGDEGRYEVIAGERRLRAAKLAGLDSVPVIVRPVEDSEALTLALLENLQREDLRPIELARGLRDLIERFGFTQRELGRTLGVSRERVSNTLRLLKLPEKIKELLDAGLLTPAHGRALTVVEAPEMAQTLGELAAEKGLTVRELETLIAGRKTLAARPLPETQSETRGLNTLPRPETVRDPNLVLFEEELMRRIGTQVKIRHLQSGRGRIIIEYYSPDELAGIIEKLTGRSSG
ncbi:ParB/RepB/Spo0J family partition protein [bacterium]|nr:ParB/RepB/Spo0J family partition protein [bacterium]